MAEWLKIFRRQNPDDRSYTEDRKRYEELKSKQGSLTPEEEAELASLESDFRS